MARLILVRHGNTFDAGETPRRVGARTDLPLSSSGRVQAEALAAQFRETRFDAAFASTLKRTRETARTILQARKESPPLLIEPFLTEIDYGPDEDKTEDEVVARIGMQALKDWDESARPPPGWLVDPGAIVAAWRACLTRLAAQEGTVLMVTSNGIARFLPEAAGLDAGLDLKLKTGAFADLGVERSGVRVAQWNQRP
jgi:broad specificity phosphatase PhoE